MKTYFDPERTWRRQRAESREGMIVRTIALDPEQHRRLKAVSKATSVTVNALLRQAAEEWLTKHEAEEAERERRDNAPAVVKKRKRETAKLITRLSKGRARK